MKKFLSLALILAILLSITAQVFGGTSVILYKDQKFGWTIRLPADFIKNAVPGKPNETEFNKKGSPDKVKVSMYSLTGLTLDSWVSRETKFIRDNYDLTLYSVTKTENSKIKNLNYRKVYLKIQTEDGWMNQIRIYVTGKSFRYLISYTITAADYKNSAKKTSMDAALASFAFTEPNAKSIGALTESTTAFDSKTKIKISNAELGWSFEVPDTWKKEQEDKKYTVCTVSNGDMAVTLKAIDNPQNVFVNDYAKTYEASLKTGPVTNKIVFKGNSSINHYSGVNYIIDRAGFEDRVYLLQEGFNLFVLTLSTRNYADTPGNNKILDAILNSINLRSDKESESISDFSEILKGATKDKVGDSYYKWSVTVPKSFTMSSRTFEGRVTVFETSDKKSMIDIEIIQNVQKQNLDSILSNVLNNLKKDYTITNSEKRTDGAQQYAVISYKGVKDDFVNEHRFYIVGDNILEIAMSQPEAVYNSGTYSKVLDSFAMSFPKDNSATDLSNIGTNGLRMYVSLKYGWFMGILPDWYVESSENKGNSAVFYNDKSTLIVDMYSKELGLTLDKLIENETARMNRVYNKELTTISQPEDITINGIKCKKINLSFKINSKMFYDSYIYYVGKSYRYKIGYSIDSAAYNDPAKKSGIDKMLNSFLCIEPNATTLGKLFDTESENTDSNGRTVSSTQYKWSVTLPSNFTEGEYYESEDEVQYTNDVTRLDFSMDVYTAKKTIEQYALDSDQHMSANSSYSVVSTEMLNEKGTTVRKAIYRYADPNADYAYYNINYMLCKNGNLYDIYFSVPDYRYTDYSTQVFKKMWDSMNF